MYVSCPVLSRVAIVTLCAKSKSVWGSSYHFPYWHACMPQIVTYLGTPNQYSVQFYGPHRLGNLPLWPGVHLRMYWCCEQQNVGSWRSILSVAAWAKQDNVKLGFQKELSQFAVASRWWNISAWAGPEAMLRHMSHAHVIVNKTSTCKYNKIKLHAPLCVSLLKFSISISPVCIRVRKLWDFVWIK